MLRYLLIAPFAFFSIALAQEQECSVMMQEAAKQAEAEGFQFLQPVQTQIGLGFVWQNMAGEFWVWDVTSRDNVELLEKELKKAGVEYSRHDCTVSKDGSKYSMTKVKVVPESSKKPLI